MRKILGAAVAAAALCLAVPGVGRAGLITFDEQYVGGLPVTVSNNGLVSTIWGGPTPLTEDYAPMGVHFSGGSPGSGGVIINDPPNWSPYGGPDLYGFGVLPHSGNNVLAFNGRATVGDNIPFWGFSPTGTASGPETIRFDDPQSAVSIWAAGGWRAHKFQLQAFDGFGNLVSTDTLTTQNWSELSVTGSDIESVVLTEIGKPWDTWVLDDLSFTPNTSVVGINGDPKTAPEPASLVLFGLGGAAFAGWRWRPRRAKAA